MSCFSSRGIPRHRRGAVLILTAMLLVVLLGLVAFAVDVGYMALTRSQLQNAADSAALASATFIVSDETTATQTARQFAAYHVAGGRGIQADWVQTELGTWDSVGRIFAPGTVPAGAIRVTVHRDAAHGGEVPLFFAPVLGIPSFRCQASAVATLNPRDIVFVVDLSGSMNNDTEPCWATGEIQRTFGPQGYPTIGEELMQMVYADFNFGEFPGVLQHVGQPLGVTGLYAYRDLVKNNGPLSSTSIASTYRIDNNDDTWTRKEKSYRWMIDQQIAAVMPQATPAPVSSDAASYAYWEKYLDYILSTPQINPVNLPPGRSGNGLLGFGNPYGDAYPHANAAALLGYYNKIGYRTYVQFMMDHGRDEQPVAGQHTPLSLQSALCPRHNEITDGGTFRFPPREQPTHATRRALIAALQVIKQRNQATDSTQRDWVAIISFDRQTGAVVRQSLTYNYDAAMLACTALQAVGDSELSTATESGLLAAQAHLAPPEAGGAGRHMSNKIVVLLTDGIPNVVSSSNSVIDQYISEHPSDDFYSSDPLGEHLDAKNAALMRCAQIQAGNWQVFPVGIGLATDYDFMDRSARRGGSANQDGQSPRGSGNPAVYEQRLKEIFQNIIVNPRARLVQ